MDPVSSINAPLMTVTNAISGDISGFINNSLNYMPADSLIPFPTDLSFTERAARYSSFSSSNYGEAQVSILETGKLSRVSSNQSLKTKESLVEFGSCLEDSSVTDPCSIPRESNAKKRKAAPKSKAKVAEQNDLKVKKYRSVGSSDEKVGFELKESRNGEEKQGKDNGSELPEPLKDYIHVRARRGQATDSHSLAERVRREKICQRMKLLQDLVPGCNKITSKALMLDEIINYVQSLQRQVEFLSMKLATLNPRFDCNLSNFISKEPLMNQTNASLPSSVYPMDNLAVTFPFTNHTKEENLLNFGVTKAMETHSSLSPIDYTLYQTPCMQQISLDVFGSSASQLGNYLWDDSLHSFVQMSLVQNQEIGFTF